MRGKFISIEGGEGVGKSTQIRLLSESLEANGLSVVTTREPGGTPGAEAIRELLLLANGTDWNLKAEALLFAAARSDHVANLIEPALTAGQWVLSDRFIDSSRAYQGIASGLGDAEILSLHRFGSNGLMPDLTVLLELPEGEGVDRALQRDSGKADRIGARDAKFHVTVEQAFQQFSVDEPDRIKRVDASGGIDNVHQRILRHISPLVP